LGKPNPDQKNSEMLKSTWGTQMRREQQKTNVHEILVQMITDAGVAN